jgi:NAD(P)H-dependent flavin oxidoreductase YrpB (nitropropane dioxygenase family)
MAGVQRSALALGVCNAGGHGSPAALLAPDALRRELTALRTGTTRPFNVNFFCHTPPEPSAEREAAWRSALAPYFEEYGIDRRRGAEAGQRIRTSGLLVNGSWSTGPGQRVLINTAGAAGSEIQRDA